MTDGNAGNVALDKEDFTKYLPEEPPKADRALPVVGNLVAELTTKGWPKNAKKKPTKAAA